MRATNSLPSGKTDVGAGMVHRRGLLRQVVVKLHFIFVLSSLRTLNEVPRHHGHPVHTKAKIRLDFAVSTPGTKIEALVCRVFSLSQWVETFLAIEEVGTCS